MSRLKISGEAQALVDSLSAEVREQVEQAAQTNEIWPRVFSLPRMLRPARASCP